MLALWNFGNFSELFHIAIEMFVWYVSLPPSSPRRATLGNVDGSWKLSLAIKCLSPSTTTRPSTWHTKVGGWKFFGSKSEKTRSWKTMGFTSMSLLPCNSITNNRSSLHCNSSDLHFQGFWRKNAKVPKVPK